jgi:ABC-2 type transport system permease protein
MPTARPHQERPVSSAQIYDSDQARRPLVTELRNFSAYWGLIRLLVTRDLTVRYKRSALGVWWTLLNPLLTSAVMYIVFSQVFRFQLEGDEPFIVYLVSGILLVTYFAQGVIAAGSAIVNSAHMLSKVYVPAEVFSLAAGAAAAANFMVSMIPLLIIQLVTGWGIPWTVIFTPIPVIAMLMLVTGLGLLVASAAVFFYDTLDLTGVAAQLLGYLTPTFYPLTIIPDHFRIFILANPLYSYLEVFRDLVYRGEMPELWTMAVMGGTSIVALLLGVWVFGRSWKNLVVLL